jgi:hypothetical protein
VQTHGIGPGFRGLVRRTLLLNFGIVLSALAMGSLWGKASALGLALVVLVTTAVLWCATFAISSFVWIGQVFWRPRVPDAKQRPRHAVRAGGVRDEWLDGT